MPPTRSGPGASSSGTDAALISYLEAHQGSSTYLAAGFGSIISEVGAVMMVGGNIKGYTRVLTTATVMETSRGNFDVAIALSIILLALAYFINLILTHVQQRERPR